MRYDLKLSVVPVLAEDLESLEEEVFHLELSPKVKEGPKLKASSSDASMKDLSGESYVPGKHKTFISGLFFAQFLGGNLRQVASISLSFPQNLEFFCKILEFFL